MRLRLTEYSSASGTGVDEGKIVITVDAGFDLNNLSDDSTKTGGLIEESVRLIVDETHPAVLTSSMQKGKIQSARINTSDSNKFDILFLLEDFKGGWESTDKFTIEVDFGETNNMIFSTLTWKGDAFNE